MKIELTPDNLADVIRQIHAESGLTISAAARKAGISRVALGRHLNDNGGLDSGTLGCYLRSQEYSIHIKPPKGHGCCLMEHPETAMQHIRAYCDKRGIRGMDFYQRTGISKSSASRALKGFPNKGRLRPLVWMRAYQMLGCTFFVDMINPL